jgi:anaerobic magnesium-protoporphyrin IX monomethyl ester cyclase
VLLVAPPQGGLLEGFSSGLIALANYLQLDERDVRVKFLDLGPVSARRLSDCVRDALKDVSYPVFVGITGTTASYQNMLHTARAFKQHDPEIVTIFGGHHATAQDDIILQRHPEVDFIIRGEGEIALSELLRHHQDPNLVPSLSFRSDNRIVRTANAPPLDQHVLDKLRATLDIDELRSPPGKFNRVTYVSARGCPLSCSFCAVGASQVRAKSVPRVIEDLRYLVGELGYKQVAIEDNFFAHKPRRTLELCSAIEELQKETEFTWDCQTRVESMRRNDIILAMARARCEATYLGVESLVEDQLIFLGKTLRPQSYLEMLGNEAVPAMLNAGIDAYMNLQLSIPDESLWDRELTLKRLMQLGRTAREHNRQITVFPQLHVMYPGTPHFSRAVADGTFGTLGDKVFEEFTLWEAERQPIIDYLGKHFAHGTGGIPIGILDIGALKKGQFKIMDGAIESTSKQLARMNQISGISIFQYASYLATAC